MRIHKTPIALAAMTLCGALPLAAQAAPTVSFRTPSDGQTISGSIRQSSACEVAGSRIERVAFFLDGRALNTERSSPWNCDIDTRDFADGTHTLRAVAYDSANASASAQISVDIRNSSSSGGDSGGGSGSGPSVSFRTPSEGQTISGTMYQSSVCEVVGSGIAKVDFFLDSTRLNTEGSAPWNCNLDTTRFSDGAHALKAVAYDSRGAASTAQIGVNIQNGSSSSGGDDGGASSPPPSGPSLSFVAPAEGGALSGDVKGPPDCVVEGTNIERVMFYLDDQWTNTDGNLSNGLGCWIDTTKYQDGAYTVKAVAYDEDGRSTTVSRSIVIANGGGGGDGGGGSTPAPGSPTVSFKTPSNGQTLSGSIYQSSACEALVAGSTGIKQVKFFLDSTALNTEGSSPWNCNLDTRKFADGTHMLKAVATDGKGATGAAQISVNLQNGTSSPTPGTGGLSFKSPTEGATLSGNMYQSSACEVTGEKLTKVQFYLDSAFLNTEGSAPWTCNLDTTKFPDGKHTLKAVATDASGATKTAQIGVLIDNGNPDDADGSSGTPGPIDPDDIVGQAQAGISFSQQNGYTAQVIGTYTSASAIPDAGIHYTVLSNGESLRLGKQADPRNSSRKALAFQVAPGDPKTSGGSRAELKFPDNIEMNKVYWTAFSIYVPNWSSYGSSEEAVFGLQLHAGNTPSGLSPSISMKTRGGDTFWIDARTSESSDPTQSNSFSTRSPQYAIPFGRWVNMVVKFKLNTSGNGFVQVWMDGTRIMDHKGSVGYNTGSIKPYFKFGYYSWSSLGSNRKVLMRSPVIVSDPTGSKYKPEDLKGYLDAQP